MRLLFLCLAIGYATAQTCTEYSGPCKTGNICDTNQTCISADGECCPNENLVNTTTLRPTTSSTTCKDKINPKTGTSDCPADVQLCTDPVYKDVMRDQCPKTCGFCSTSYSPSLSSSTTPSTTCKDKLNPKTGTSDCPADIQLCTDPDYKDVMKDQCPKTCGFCSGTSSSTCQDQVNPSTGTSDCPQKEYLCQTSGYVDFMKVQCPKTCGYCS